MQRRERSPLGTRPKRRRGLGFPAPSLAVSLAAELGPGTGVFFGAKTGWPLDNGGDDLAILSPSGVTEDHLRFGEGPAVDLFEGEGPSDGRAPPVVPAGASFGRWGGGVRALIPTPGGDNRPLWGANESKVRLAGLIFTGKDGAPVACPGEAASFSPY